MNIQDDILFHEIIGEIQKDPWVIQILPDLPAVAMIAPDSFTIYFNPEYEVNQPEISLIHEILHFIRGKSTDYNWSDSDIERAAKHLFNALPESKKEYLKFCIKFLAGKEQAKKILRRD